jgi:hypothetical protein
MYQAHTVVDEYAKNVKVLHSKYVFFLAKQKRVILYFGRRFDFRHR